VIRTPLFALGAVGIAAALAGCGGSKSSSPTTTTAPPPPPATSTSTPTQTQGGGAGALQAEAASAATGDIPDNQVFLTFQDNAAGYSIKYPEGWARSGSGNSVTFRDKNNIVRVVVTTGSPPSLGEVKRQVGALKGATITTPPTKTTIGGKPAIHVVYETQSAQNAVTGKTVTLGVDRYYLWNGKKVAIVDLGTPVKPVKVDNVDAYRLIIQSFRWR
jgi:photosystem II reaction center protein PsbP